MAKVDRRDLSPDRVLRLAWAVRADDEHRVTVERTLRPLRVGYRVDPRSSAQIQSAVETATMHWGGAFHALIPSFRSRPPWWNQSVTNPPWGQPPLSAAAIAREYEEAFECDFIVATKADSDTGGMYPVSLRRLREKSREAATGVGMSVLAVYDRLWREEFRFVSTRRAPIIVPTAPDEQLELFVDVCFGRFTKSRPDIEDEYRSTFGPEEVAITPEAILDISPALTNRPLAGPLAVGQFGLSFAQFGPRAEPLRQTVIVLVDPRDPVDLFDFWNLRASGADTIPIPTIWIPELVESLATRLLHRPRASPGPIYLYAGRRASASTARPLVDGLTARGIQVWPTGPATVGPLLGQTNAAQVEAARDQIGVTISRGLLEIPPVAAPFPGGDFAGIPAWTESLNLSSWGLPENDSIAPFIPSRLGDVSRIIGPGAPSHVRAGKRGLEIPVPIGGLGMNIQWPSGREVLEEVLRQLGFEPTASDPGRVAERLVAQLGGLSETALLRNLSVLKLLNRAASTGVEMPIQTRDEPRRLRVNFIKHQDVMRVLGQAFGSSSAPHVLDLLVDRNVLRLGLTVECALCHYPNWLELDAIRREIQCERCLGTYAFPQSSPPDKSAWAYRPTGSCGVENYARGGYAVVQALRQLRTPGEPMVGCTATQLAKSLEIDFVALKRRRQDVPHLLFGEAKTLGPFGAKDLRLARTMLRRVPDSTFVFATMRDELTPAEKKAIKRLARPTTRRLIDVPRQPRILVLTALELSGHGTLADCWRRAGAETAEKAERAEHYVRDDPELWADITLQLHIGAEPHSDWVNREYRRLGSSVEGHHSMAATRGSGDPAGT